MYGATGNRAAAINDAALGYLVGIVAADPTSFDVSRRNRLEPLTELAFGLQFLCLTNKASSSSVRHSPRSHRLIIISTATKVANPKAVTAKNVRAR